MISDEIISAIAERDCKRTCHKVIRHLQSLKEGYIQSGDDTPLRNIWDEVCVQVQGQESFVWEDAYLETIRGVLLGFVDDLDTATKQAIWLQTQAGEQWQDEEEDGAIPYSDEDVVEYILHSYVLSAAEDYTNLRIQKYLERSGDLD